eukprot:scaffold14410_cov60-Phaeocystis_antarctica.AAC.12
MRHVCLGSVSRERTLPAPPGRDCGWPGQSCAAFYYFSFAQKRSPAGQVRPARTQRGPEVPRTGQRRASAAPASPCPRAWFVPAGYRGPYRPVSP